MSFESPEQAAFRKHQFTLAGAEITKLKSLLAEFENLRPNPAAFRDLYPAETVQTDLDYVKTKQAGIDATESPDDRDDKFYSLLAEVILQKLGSVWLPGALSPGAKFDDFKNGVDLIAEVIDQVTKKIYIMGMDVTTSERRAIEKARMTINDLETGKLGQVRYFNGKLSRRRGETALPKVIIGLPPEQVVGLARSYWDALLRPRPAAITFII